MLAVNTKEGPIDGMDRISPPGPHLEAIGRNGPSAIEIDVRQIIIFDSYMSSLNPNVHIS